MQYREDLQCDKVDFLCRHGQKFCYFVEKQLSNRSCNVARKKKHGQCQNEWVSCFVPKFEEQKRIGENQSAAADLRDD